jgi:hypothetical protein
MDLTPYVEDLQRQLSVAAAAGGPDAEALAARLIAPLEAATRLILLNALSDAASEITGELAPTTVDVRLRGLTPEFVVTTASFDDAEPRPTSTRPTGASDADDEGGTTRTTLRLPDALKTRVEEAAAGEGLSVNSWLVRAVSAAVEPQRASPRARASAGEQFTGWVR